MKTGELDISSAAIVTLGNKHTARSCDNVQHHPTPETLGDWCWMPRRERLLGGIGPIRCNHTTFSSNKYGYSIQRKRYPGGERLLTSNIPRTVARNRHSSSMSPVLKKAPSQCDVVQYI